MPTRIKFSHKKILIFIEQIANMIVSSENILPSGLKFISLKCAFM